MIFHNIDCSFCTCLDMRRHLSHPSEGMEFRHSLVLLREKFVNGEKVPVNQFEPDEQDLSVPFEIAFCPECGRKLEDGETVQKREDSY